MFFILFNFRFFSQENLNPRNIIIVQVRSAVPTVTDDGIVANERASSESASTTTVNDLNNNSNTIECDEQADVAISGENHQSTATAEHRTAIIENVDHEKNKQSTSAVHSSALSEDHNYVRV